MARGSKVKKLFSELDVEAVFLTNREMRDPNIIYFTDRKVSSRCALILTRRGKILLEPGSERFPKLQYARKTKKGTMNDSAGILKKYKKVGINGSCLSFRLASWLRKKTKSRILDVSEELDRFRARKEPSELKAVKDSCKLADRAMELAHGMLRKGVTEEKVKNEIVSFLKEKDAYREDPLVIFGPNCRYIHNPAGARRLKPGDTVIIDIFPTYREYYADTSRTFCLKPGNREKRIINLVFKAYELALQDILPGMKAGEAFSPVMDYFRKNKVGKNFTHGLGHGIGINIHEYPSLARDSKHVLEKGMVFTIEPGLYFNWGGARIEDTFLLTEKGCRPLTSSSIP